MVSDVYLELRELVLRGDPHARGWGPSVELPSVWGALVEVGLPDAPATLVALVDGTTSLYLGTGGATVGAGAAEPVARAARQLLRAVEAALPDLRPAWELPVPPTGRARVVALTYAGAFDAEAELGDLEAGRDPLAAVFAASEATLAEIGRLEAAMRPGQARDAAP
jgi:hypothetical protein